MFLSLLRPRLLITPGLTSRLIAWLLFQLGLVRVPDSARGLINALKHAFAQALPSNVFISLPYIPSSFHPAGLPSHRLSDAPLSPVAWAQLQRMFWGSQWPFLLPMALPSNVQCDLFGQPFPFFPLIRLLAARPLMFSPRIYRYILPAYSVILTLFFLLP